MLQNSRNRGLSSFSNFLGKKSGEHSNKGRRSMSGLLGDFSQSPQKRFSQHSRKQRCESQSKGSRQNRFEALLKHRNQSNNTAASTVKLSAVQQNILRSKQKQYSNVYLVDGRQKRELHNACEDLSQLLQAIGSAQINNERINYEHLYLPPERLRNNNVWGNQSHVTTVDDLTQQQPKGNTVSQDENGWSSQSKIAHESIDQVKKERKQSQLNHRALQNLKNSLKAIKTMKILRKRNSEDHLDQNSLKIVRQVNKKEFKLKFVMRVLRNQDWQYAWLDKASISIRMSLERRLRLDMVVYYVCNGKQYARLFVIHSTYDIIKTCKRLASCKSDLEFLCLVYHHTRTDPPDWISGLVSLKDFLKYGCSGGKFTAESSKPREAYRILKNANEQQEFSVVKIAASLPTVPSESIRQPPRISEAEQEQQAYVHQSELINTVHDGQMGCGLDELMRPKWIGSCGPAAGDKPLFAYHQQFEYGFLRLEHTHFTVANGSRKMMKDGMLSQIDIRSSIVRSMLCQSPWRKEIFLLLKLQFAVNRRLSGIASRLVLDQVSSQQQRILPECSPHASCFSELRMFRGKRYSMVTRINYKLKTVTLVVASAGDRDVRHKVQISHAELDSTYQAVCQRFRQDVLPTTTEEKCRKITKLLTLSKALTYLELSLSVSVPRATILTKKLPNQTMGVKHCFRLTGGVYCLGIMLTCSITGCRYLYCYLPRNQKNYLRLVEAYEDELQVMQSVRQDMCSEVVTRRSLVSSLTTFKNNESIILNSSLKKRKLLARREGIRSGSIRQTVQYGQNRLKENCVMEYCQAFQKQYLVIGNVFKPTSYADNSDSECSQLEIKIHQKHRLGFFRWTGNVGQTFKVLGLSFKAYCLKTWVRLIISRLCEQLVRNDYKSHDQLTHRLAELLEGKTPYSSQQHHSYYAYGCSRLLGVDICPQQNRVRVALLQDGEQVTELQHQEIQDLSRFLVKSSNHRISRRICRIVGEYQRTGYI